MKTAVRFTLLLLLPAIAFASSDMPNGWFRAGSHPGDYEMGSGPAHTGKAGAYLKSTAENPKGFGTLMQAFRADRFHGKRVRMTGWVKTDKVTSWAGLWMRVDGADASRDMLAFDNMQKRPIKGTLDWARYQVVLDVAPEAKDIAFGVLLNGAGTVWLDDVAFEVVDKSVATTSQGFSETIADNPMNLDFEK